MSKDLKKTAKVMSLRASIDDVVSSTLLACSAEIERLEQERSTMIDTIEKEVTDSVSIMLKPHIAGVFAVIREKLNQEQGNE